MIALQTYRFRLKIVQEIRSFFTERGFLEADSPLLASHSIPESNIPLFKTIQNHPQKEDRVLQLLPSPEYYLKQLLANGWGNLFQLARSFRNGENTGRIHSPEFTMLEYYAVDADYMDGIRLTEDLFNHLFARLQPRTSAPPVPFPRMSMEEAFGRYAKLDLASICSDSAEEAGTNEENLAPLQAACQKRALEFDLSDNWESLFNRLFLNLVEPKLLSDFSAIVLYNYPSHLPSLSKAVAGSPWTQRWELYWQEIELANCFTEEDDVDRINNFFRREMKKMLGEKGEAASMADPLFAAKIGGLPRCSGTALGLDRLVMLLAGENSIRKVMPFAFG